MIINSKVKLISKLALLCLTILIVISGLGVYWKHQSRFSDNSPYRGAQYTQNKQFLDGFDKFYPGPQFPNSQINGKWQGWTASQSMWYYNTTQGSDLIPYDFFLFLEQHNSNELFRSEKNFDKFRYIVQKPTESNPDGLPLGFVKDEYLGKSYVGLTCAACHTSQVVYNKTAIRIDGGPAMANMDMFMRELEAALSATLQDKNKKHRFIANVLNYNLKQGILGQHNYDNEQAIEADLHKYMLQVSLYNYINFSPTEYGYARLDAFGRIFNRVLQHTLNKKQLQQSIAESFDGATASELLRDLNDGLVDNDDLPRVFDRLISQFDLDPDSVNLVENMAQLRKLKEILFNAPDAPVSYPFLWDIAQHDYVQWNGIAANAGVGAVGRNTGEVMGVFATLDWYESKNGTLSTLIGGQPKNDNGKYTHFKSSVDLTNLRLIESQLKDLTSPMWPEEILGRIKWQDVKAGQTLFEQHCGSCHLPIEATNPRRKVVAQMAKLEAIQTDEKMAANSVNFKGHTGILEGIYLGTDVGDILLQEQAPVAAILTAATRNVVATPDPDKGWLANWFDWLYNLAVTFFDNDIKQSIKRGDYNPDTTANPWASLLAYKARPMNGVWATAPYLHNGSVPTLYDLLLPKCDAKQIKAGEKCRPEQFVVGSRLFDPEKVGFVSDGYEGFIFDTSKVGNSNAGHEYGTKDIQLHNGQVLPALTDKQRWQIVEYMKSI
ncbi:di-heme-cytochrome C peroxidase [Catenovulum agarivorans]|uniref:di-heme-cytochrome C peroxidase n=1 Tax=Catenovulum agarivorans TaxID=1172192 RepID=UPI0002E611F9|nr:di-heme-cytochrome C peroxidase [Catenovulum agarivorans]